jgi:uncharacterized protein
LNDHFAHIIALELNLKASQVLNTVRLLDSGATVPFIARYRKEMTGSLDELVIIKIRDRLHQIKELEKRREAILNSVKEQGKLTEELEKQIKEAATLSTLEDIYLPYRPKRKTRGSMAREKGLEPLARMIMSQTYPDIATRAMAFISEEKGITTADEAINGAMDIAAEWINEHKYTRGEVRKLFFRSAVIRSRVIKGKEKDGENYQTYFQHEELLHRAPSHRILAMFRGENEKILNISIAPPEEDSIALIVRNFLKKDSKSSDLVHRAIRDSYKRLLQPSLETEMRNWAKDRADETAIQIFTDNLRQLLMAPPLGPKNILAIDPGYRTGCKVVCLDKQGNLLHNETIYPHPPVQETRRAMNKIETLVNAYDIEAIAIGNGTASRETEEFIKQIRFKKDIIAVIVDESGASVYSASTIAREEFPDYDVTVRGAVSIGRRLMDPLAELVKIDPKSIGVGQYQHDVNQASLQRSLQDVVVSCVNQVGVDLNTASREILTYVSGVGPSLAQNIVDFRKEHGAFSSRDNLKDVSRFGEKAYEQAAGFLRIHNGDNLLDGSAVHPESYSIVYKMAEKVKSSVSELMSRPELRTLINLNEFVTESTGLPTLTDILEELAKPGRDPRKHFEVFEFDKNIHTLDDLVPGRVLPGIVTNITAFGIFVDIGIHQTGLVHISQLSESFIKDPNEVVQLHQKVKVKVLDVDKERKRVQLSMKGLEQKKIIK